MSLPHNNEPIADELLDEMLLSLREEEDTQEKPPVINLFRLEMERERRRSRIQLEIVTIAAFVSVIATVVFTGVFFRFMLPDMMTHGDRRTRELLLSFQSSVNSALADYSGILIALALAFLMGTILSAVLLISKRKEIFTPNK